MDFDPSSATPAGGSAPAPATPNITPEDYFGVVKQMYPNAVFNGGGRTPQRNAAVGGVPNSMHLSDQALDFNVPGVDHAQVLAALKSAGLPMTEGFAEGQVGSQGAHLHVGWAPKGTSAAPAPKPTQTPAAFDPTSATAAFDPTSAKPVAPQGNWATALTGGVAANGQPNFVQKGLMDFANSHFVKGITGAYDESVTGGLLMQPVRAAMEGMGYGMDQLRAAHPGQSDAWYNTTLHNMYNQAVNHSRQQAQTQTAQNPYPGHQVANFAANVVGAPENLLLGGAGIGKTVAMRIATAGGANAIINTVSDAAAQGMDMLEGQKKKFDVDESLRAAETGAVLGGALHTVGEAAPFVKQLFSDRGVDTKPSADPRTSPTSPMTTDHVQMNAQDAATYQELLKTGDVDDIKNFFKGRNGPQPSYVDVNNWVNHRDLAPQNVDDTHLQPEFNYEAEYNKSSQRQAVEDHITQQTQGWKNAPQFEVVHGPHDIEDPEIRAQALADDPNGTGLGFLGADGKVRVYSGRVDSPDLASAVTFHEGLGHFGLQEAFGTKLDSTINTLLDRNVSQFGRDVDAWQKANPGAYGGDRTRAAEEVLAEASQNGTIKPTWQQALSASVRQFGRKMGLKLSYSDAEVNQVLAMAHDAVVNGKGRDARANGFNTAVTRDANGNKYMFTGPKATGFDPNSATAMTDSQGNPHNEISDQNARLGAPMGTLGDTLDHPGLYEQYPHLKNVPVIHQPMPDMLGAYSPKTGRMFLNTLDKDKLSTVLHETQHAIQHYEGQMRAGDGTVHLSPEEYAHNPLENEARATEDRRDMSMSDRAATPAKFMHKNAMGEEQTDPELLDHIDRLKQDPRFWTDPDFRANVIELARTREPGEVGPARTSFDDMPKFMQANQYKAAQPDYVSDDLERVYKSLTDNYVPTTVSWEETKRSALDLGFKPSQIRDLGETQQGELATRLWRMQSAANMADQKLSQLEAKLDSPDWSVADKATYIKTLSDFHYLSARVKGDRSEYARALNVSKAARSYTNSTMEEVAEALRAQSSGLANLADDSTSFLKFARQMKALRDGGANPKGTRAMMDGVNKTYWEQYLTTFHMNMMLSALSTHVKAPIDMATGITRNVIEKTLAIPVGKVRQMFEAMTGKTPEPGVTVAELANHVIGITRAVTDAEVYRRMVHAVKTGEGSYVDASGKSVPTNFTNQFGATSNPRIPGVSIPTDLISAQDTFFRSVEMNAQLDALGAREARKQLGKGATTSDIMTMGHSLATNPTADMLREAVDLSNRTLLLNNNPLNNMIDKYRAYRPGLSTWDRATHFIVANLAPFIRVESNNLINRVIQRSPLGFLDPYTIGQLKTGGAKADIAMTKIMYGSVLIGMSWMAADQVKNKITGEGPSNVDKYKELEASGFHGRAVHENGRYNVSDSLGMSVNPFDQHNATATMTAAAREAYDKGMNRGSVGTALKLALGSVFHNLGNMSWVKDIDPALGLFSNTGDQAEGKFNQFVGSEAGSFAPSAMRQAARLTDPNQHDVVDPHSITNTVANEFQAATPGASKGLPIRYSVYGDPLQNGASLTGVHTMIPGLLGNGTTETRDPTEMELERLTRLPGVTSAIITPVMKTMKIEDQPAIKLTTEQFEQYQHYAGKTIVYNVQQAMSDPSWSTLTDRDKIVQVREIETESKKAAREALYGQFSQQH